jgi:ankyrin repeat protein
VDAVLQTIHQYYYYIPSLVYAIHNDCNTNIIKYIVARGADVNVKSKNSNNTPLGEAIHNNDLDLVKYLMEHKANLKEAIYENELPLNVAIEFGDLEMIDFLIKNGLDINSRKNSYKSWSEVPLGKAAYLGNFELVKTLIEKYGANVNDDVLNSGVCSGNKEIVKYLIECGADINAKGHNRINNNSFDIDPLYHAIFKDYKEIVEYLIDMGAKINMSDTHRDSHLNAAIISHKKNMVKYLINLTITESNCEEYTFTKYAYKLNEYCNNNDKYRQTYLNIKEYLNLYEDHFNINSFIIS